MRLLLAILIPIALASSLAGADVVSTLLKDSVATFSDSYDLIYYSVKNTLAREAKSKSESIQAEFRTTNERIEEYLLRRGVALNRDQQPITRADFAKLVIKRFELPRSFFTGLFGSASWYFRDAIKAGLFAEADQSDGTMSTREMLSVFTKAEAASRKR